MRLFTLISVALVWGLLGITTGCGGTQPSEKVSYWSAEKVGDAFVNFVPDKAKERSVQLYLLSFNNSRVIFIVPLYKLGEVKFVGFVLNHNPKILRFLDARCIGNCPKHFNAFEGSIGEVFVELSNDKTFSAKAVQIEYDLIGFGKSRLYFSDVACLSVSKSEDTPWAGGVFLSIPPN